MIALNPLGFYSCVRFLSAFLISLVILFPVGAQPDLNFIRYTTEQGLANDDVTCICQDHLGFIWFGTKDGCSRFDGMKFKTFQYEQNNPGSIAPGWVNGIVRDKNNDLWFALSGEGSPLMKYDYQKDVFVDMDDFIKEQLNFKGETINCWTIFCDSEGLLWLQLAAPDNFLVQYNPENKKLRVFESQKENFAKDFFESADGKIWLAGYNITVYDKKKDSFQFIKDYLTGFPDLLFGNRVFQDSDGHIWLNVHNGLYELDNLPSSSYKHYYHEPGNQNSLSNNLVYDIIEDNDNNILIGTINGLCLLDKQTKKIYRYFNDEIDPESINSNLIRSIYRDKQNTIWIGTSAGAGKLQTKKFQSFSQSLYKNSLTHNKVQCISQANGSDVWIGTPRGIDIFDIEKGTFRFFRGISNETGGLLGSPIDFDNDIEKGRMWIGTWRGGFSRFDYKSGQFANYISRPATKEISHVNSIFCDSKDRLWIAVNTKPHMGLYLYSLEKGTIKFFCNNPNIESTISSNSILNIMEDSKGHIWIGVSNGLNRIVDIKNGTFTCFLKGKRINHCIESSDKHLCVATDKGLYRLNTYTKESTKYDVTSGLPGNNVRAILKDDFNNFWLSTNKGLAHINKIKDTSVNVIVFRNEEGVRVGNFLPGSCAKLSDGTLMFGGTNGFCRFHPEHIKKDTTAPDIVFTHLKIANSIVKTGDTINNQVLLPQSIETTKQLVLNYKNNDFAIEFSGIQYNLPKYIKYAFRLDAHDAPNHWHFRPANDREVGYMNLPGGDYTFQVKAANSYGVWNRKTTNLSIKILPPWWKTIWFTALCVVVIVIFIVIIIKIRTYRLQKQKQKLEETVRQRTYQLQDMNLMLEEGKEELEVQAQRMEAMNKKLSRSNIELEAKTVEVENMAKKIHEADQKQLRFFANISHEFRTPLSLIIGPLEKYMNTKKLSHLDEWGKVYNHLQLMHRNAKRLLRLVNEIIDFRKLNTGSKKLNPSSNNIIEFIQEIVNIFSPMAETKDIHLSFIIEHLSKNIDHSTLDKEQGKMINDFWFDPDIMEKILYNLISNAIKYTPEGGQISIAISIVETQNIAPIRYQLAIKISDTGLGITPENLNRIFERFFRVETPLMESKPENQTDGVGIGLAFTKELVELHKGSITVESEPGKGTVFSLIFPINKKTDSKEKLTEAHVSHKLDYTKSKLGKKFNEDSHSQKEADTTLSISQNTKQNAHSQSITGENSESENQQPDVSNQQSSILIVEDNPDLRNFIKGEIDEQYTIYEAQNGKMGLEIAENKNPDLIISDIMMPVMDGIELSKKIKSNENTSHIPIILLTAKAGEDNMLTGLETGVDDYITKPFSVNILKAKIKNILTIRKQLQEKFSHSIDYTPSEYMHSQIDEKFLQKAIQIVNENLGDEQFDNDAFVNHMDCSRSQVYKKIKSLTNESVSGFIRNIRLKAAAKLFLSGNSNVADVCFQVGFKDPSILTRHFSKMFGKPPREFIKENLSEK